MAKEVYCQISNDGHAKAFFQHGIELNEQSPEGQKLAQDAVVLVQRLFKNLQLTSLPYDIPHSAELDALVVTEDLPIPVVILGRTGTKWNSLETSKNGTTEIKIESTWWPTGMLHETSVRIDTKKLKLSGRYGISISNIYTRHHFLDSTLNGANRNGDLITIDAKGKPIGIIEDTELSHLIIFTGLQGSLPGMEEKISGCLVYKPKQV